jgi:septum site-determining protein MinD
MVGNSSRSVTAQPKASSTRSASRGSGKVVTVTSGKGGVGKTTTTANLGVALGRLGKKVVLIDADIGLRNLDVIMGLENRIIFDLVDIIEGRARPRQALVKHKLVPELYLIPAAQSRDKTAVSPADMIRLSDELRREFDYILIDCPAGIERGFRNAIAPADEVLIVTNPEVSAVRDADRVIGLIEAENKGPAQLILNRVKIDMVKRGDMLSPDDVTDILAIKIIGIVPDDDGVIPASNNGTPVTLNPNSRAGQAFTNIARRLVGEDVPFMRLDSPENFFQRFFRRRS